ncbi:MAG: hypothetical protein ACOYOS_07655, partial [Syntrophales bacterium]
MNKQSFVSLNAVKSQGGLSSFLSFGPSALLSVLGILFITLVIPLSVYSADKLIVQDLPAATWNCIKADGVNMMC